MQRSDAITPFSSKLPSYVTAYFSMLEAPTLFLGFNDNAIFFYHTYQNGSVTH
jgi:hypothetical protein